MGRSGGARPKKAVREEVLALRAQLGKLRSYDWVKAQMIFDRMTDLCGVRGPSNGKMAPRACRYCDYYGHTRQFCPKRKADQEWKEDQEYQKIKRDWYHPIKGPDDPRCRDQEHWEWILHTRAIMDAYNREHCPWRPPEGTE